VRLVFYGGGTDRENEELNLKAISLSESKKPTITYIPSCSYDSELDYFDFVNEHKRYGVKKFIYFPIDSPFDHIMLREVLKCDIVHLSGGNTYYFVKHLRQSGMTTILKQFANKGGVITGLSAGAIIMTPTIAAASYPKFDCDDNDDGIRNFKGLNLVNFEFFPHYKGSSRYDVELRKQSKKLRYPIYAASDGSGVVVNEDRIHFLGKVSGFVKGQKFTPHFIDCHP